MIMFLILRQEDPNCFTFFDVCDRGSFHRLDSSRRIGPLRCNMNPASLLPRLVNHLKRLSTFYNAWWNHILEKAEQNYGFLGHPERCRSSPGWPDWPASFLLWLEKPEAPDLVEDYARHCWEYNVQLDDAIHLLQVSAIKWLNDVRILLSYLSGFVGKRA